MQIYTEFLCHQNVLQRFFVHNLNSYMEEDVKSRILRFLRYKGINPSQFSLLIGASRNYVSSMSKSIQPDKLQSISVRFPELNIEWLLVGKGEMLSNDNPTQERREDFFEKKLMEFFQRRDTQYQMILSQNSEIIRQNGEILKRVLEMQNKNK